MKILHTGDLHIGMRFGNYPEPVRVKLAEARIQALQNLVNIANDRKCNLFVVAGDMFEGHRVAKETVIRAADILNSFAGECVLVLPGNHDHYDEQLWPVFQQAGPELVLLKESRVYNLGPWGLDIDVYPAPCHTRHSETNNLGWISKAPDNPRLSLGVAHGTLAGLSPDLDNSYFPMTTGELRATGLDLWLLGHAHVRYPDFEPQGELIFNAGSPEPDGMNFRGRGSAWLLEVDEQRKIRGEGLVTGTYRFLDLEYDLVRDFSQVENDLLGAGSDRDLVRLTLRGSLEAEVLAQRAEVYSRLEESLFHLEINDSRLGLRVSPAVLDREFTAESFPLRLLNKLTHDSEALQIAYELIQDVKSCK